MQQPAKQSLVAPEGTVLESALCAHLGVVTRTGEHVASPVRLFLKRITPRLRAEPLAQLMMQVEIAALQTLSAYRPAICPALCGHGVDSAGPWLLTELLVGADLAADVRARGPYPLDSARALWHSGLAALAVCHAHGVVHGDLSPSNLWIDALPAGAQRGSALRLLDFDRARTPTQQLPHDRQFRGTLAYASPRVVRGHEPQPEDDRFALAASVLFALTGTAPRPELGAALWLAAGQAPPQVPSLRDGELERALCAALAL